jgi:hypothetical protein
MILSWQMACIQELGVEQRLGCCGWWPGLMIESNGKEEKGASVLDSGRPAADCFYCRFFGTNAVAFI